MKYLLRVFLLTATGMALAADAVGGEAPEVHPSSKIRTVTVEIPVTIEARAQFARKRLAELKEELAQCPPDDRSAKANYTRGLLTQKIRLRQAQITALDEQKRIAAGVEAASRKTYSAGKMEEFKERIARHTRERRDWGYNQKDIQFADEMLAMLRTGEIDPNIEVVDSTYERYSGPLLKLVSSGRIQKKSEWIDELLKLGVRVDRSNGFFDPRLLLKGGVDDLGQSLQRVISVARASEKTCHDLIMLNCDVYSPAANGDTVLQHAVRYGMNNIVTLLILDDVSPNTLNSRGETALFEAIRSNRPETAQLLLNAGCDPNIVDTFGKKAADYRIFGKFIQAVLDKDAAAVKAITAQGVSPDTPLPDGMTPVQYACNQEDAKLLQALIDAGADLNFKGRGNIYPAPLQIVFTNGKRNPALFALLLKHGADPNIPPRGYGGMTMLEYLSRTSHDINRVSDATQLEFLKALIVRPDATQKKGARNLLLSALNSRKDREFILEILKVLPDLKDCNDALCLAVIRKYPAEIIKMMIDKHADVNAAYREWGGHSAYMPPLYAAVRNGSPVETIRLLLDAGADVGWKDANGKTALDLPAPEPIKNLLRSKAGK